MVWQYHQVGRRQKARDFAPKSTKIKGRSRQDLSSHLRSSYLVIIGLQHKCQDWTVQARWWFCWQRREDRERLMSKSEDSFPLQVQTWELCGGFLLVRGKWERNFNCGVWVFVGNKRLDQLSYIGWLKHIKKGEFKGEETQPEPRENPSVWWVGASISFLQLEKGGTKFLIEGLFLDPDE